MKKKTILTVLAITVLTMSIFGARTTYAQTPTPIRQDFMQDLIQKISQRFGLKQDDVQEVFDQVKKDKESEMESRYEVKLDSYVKEGKITEAQKQLIVNKRKELQTEMQKEIQNKQNLTQSERKAQMEKKREEIDAWAKANGIDPQYLGFFFKGGFGMKGMGMHRGWR